MALTRDACQPTDLIVDHSAGGLTDALADGHRSQFRRAWMRSLIDAAQVPHQLHYLDTPDEVCKARLRTRNATGTHPFSVSEAEFDQVSDYFVAPAPKEGFNIVHHHIGAR